MKKTFLTVAACLIAMLTQAQILQIGSIEKISIPLNQELKVAGFSPMGDYILLTDDADQGLIHYNLTTKAITTISDAPAAGWGVQIADNGKEIIYQEMEIDENNMVYNNVVKHNLYNKTRSIQASKQRSMENMINKSANLSITINENLHMLLTRNGKTITLHPNGANEAYNWASISPDGTKILYYVSAKGCFVCDINGQNISFIAHHCRAPKWYDNNTIIGMADEDNGKWLTASAIVAYTLDGKHQILINKENMAIYPYTANGKIAFSNASGEIFIMQVK